jgi:hypothetical protein
VDEPIGPSTLHLSSAFFPGTDPPFGGGRLPDSVLPVRRVSDAR